MDEDEVGVVCGLMSVLKGASGGIFEDARFFPVALAEGHSTIEALHIARNLSVDGRWRCGDKESTLIFSSRFKPSLCGQNLGNERHRYAIIA